MLLRYAGIFFALPLLVMGCKKNPYERTENAQGGATGTYGNAGSLKVFSHELFTGGGSFFYPGGQQQSITFKDESNPISARSIRYHWNGQASNGSELTFAGFDLMHTAVQDDYTATAGRDLRAAGYTKVKFYARGSLTTNVVLKIEVSDDGANPGVLPGCLVLSTNGTTPVTTGNQPCTNVGRLTEAWQAYTISLSNPNSQLASVKDYFKATFVYSPLPGFEQTPSQGGTVYFDQIFYEP